ncbi:hypothetical protein PCYB_123750 [Plasmodium cynomolgi strain B]|uniref:Uncharacterized protein n=1 Tax=Plasmodium cynomolgi (strain B) TaxID=1120755 RepID=K6UW18_PLACD|nr:hypothetical protein PCYB_123750 [Plasmodium cynomolgi strain B]GAB67809.1 hypothetical protein PCYB_123750 [Plasmodium cynomolgi strain B]
MTTQKADEQMRGEGGHHRSEKKEDAGEQVEEGKLEEHDTGSDVYAILEDQPEKEKEKKTLKGKITELEKTINKKIVQLQKELNESKQNRKTQDLDFSEILREFKNEITQKINQVTQPTISGVVVLSGLEGPNCESHSTPC